MKNKKFYSSICILFLLFVQTALAQAPQGMNYQAIARDAGGLILSNKNISIRFTITNGNGGQVLYKEHQSAATNQFGLFTLNVGNGTADTLTFSSIDWTSTVPWMQVEMDANGGSNYTSMGTSQLLSVPYALYAASSSTGQSSNTVYGTAGITITAADTSFPFTIIPGLTQTLNVPANSKLLISASGAVETTASTAAGYSVVDVVIYIDGAYGGLGCYKRVIAANNTGLAGMITNFDFIPQTKIVSPGSHTVDVRAFYAQGSSAYVSSDQTSVLQGALTVTVLKQ